MNLQLLPTIAYFLVFVTLMIYYIRTKKQPLFVYITGIWSFSSFFAIIFQSLYPGYDDITVLPYAFMILCFLISLYPLRSENNWESDNLPMVGNKFYSLVMWGFVLISIVPFYENLMQLLSTYGAQDTSSLAEMYDDKMEGVMKTPWLSNVGLLANSIDGVFIQFLVFTPFYFITQRQISKSLKLLSFLPVLTHILFQLCVSGRGFVTQFLLNAVIFLIIFHKQIPKATMRYIRVYGAGFAVAFFMVMSVLTVARRDSTNDGVDTEIVLGFYLAKSHLDFNQNLWNIEVHTEGDNSFGFAKTILGMEVPEDKNEYWNVSKLGVIPSLFYTYIGDWFMDFGAIITLLLFIIFAFLADLLFKRRKEYPTLMMMFMYYIYSSIIVNGWTINIFKGIGSVRNILFSIALLFIVSILSKIRYEK